MNGAPNLEWLRSRRSVRVFDRRRIPRAVLLRIVEAAITAPSSTNRQPWRFAVVTAASLRAALVAAVRSRTEAMKEIIRRSHHAEDFGRYGDFFFEPLETAAAIVVPQYREYPDLLAELIRSGGGDPASLPTASAMQAELCSTSAATMALLLQAHAEGLGGCWMAGPMVARDEVQSLLGIAPPWRMVGAVALGWPAEMPEARPRKPVSQVVQWHQDPEETDERIDAST
jgi:nitroreductase